MLAHADDVVAALAGADVGTCFHPTGGGAPARLLWLAHATTRAAACGSTPAR